MVTVTKYKALFDAHQSEIDPAEHMGCNLAIKAKQKGKGKQTFYGYHWHQTKDKQIVPTSICASHPRYKIWEMWLEG